MAQEEFWDHYTGPHAAIARKLPDLRKMVLSRVVGQQSAEWDAVGELEFDDAAAADRAFAAPEIAELLAQDRPLFLGRSEVIFVEETVFWSADTPEE
jgi:uncharacterized protein (TIGR02118 family)